MRECCIGKKQRQELLDSLKDVKQLKQGRRGAYTEALRGYNSWEDVQEHVKNGGDPQLTSFFNLVERFSEDRLKYLVERTTRTNKDARVSLTTAHRSKGQQWDRVLISDEFSEKVKAPSRTSDNRNSTRSSREEEVRLFYVALTRARSQVQIPTFLADHFDFSEKRGAEDTAPKQPRSPSESRTSLPYVSSRRTPSPEPNVYRDILRQRRANSAPVHGPPSRKSQPNISSRAGQIVVVPRALEARRKTTVPTKTTQSTIIPSRFLSPDNGAAKTSDLGTKASNRTGRHSHVNAETVPQVDASNELTENTVWRLQQRVKHPHHGDGTINAVLPVSISDRYGQRVTVQFDSGVSHTVATALAQMKLIG